MNLSKFDWDIEKNEILKKQRGLCFEDVVLAIDNNEIITITEHFNTQKYPYQQIIILKLNVYVHYVPFVLQNDTFFLKTIVPSRKLNKFYNLKD